MKNIVTVIAFSGLVATASAQDFSLSMVRGGDVFSTTTITIDVVGDASVGTHMLGGRFGLSTNSNSLVSDITWTAASWSNFNSDSGYDGEGNFDEIAFGQLVLPGVPPFDVPEVGSDLGQRIGSFQVQLSEPLTLMNGIDFSFVIYSPLSLLVIDIDTGTSIDNTIGALTLNGLSVPAPSSLALLGLGGLIVGRRRR